MSSAPETRPVRACARDARGAVAVEYLIAFVPVMWFFASTWQIADLYAAQLIVQRAASAAGRAASVVLPDNRRYYNDLEENSYSGARRTQIELAANLVLQASTKILASPTVTIENASGAGPLTARVQARYSCFPGWGNLVCGADGEQTLQASARYPYHSAKYVY
jgi:Flp pilus assembly protein TadG